MGAETVRPAPSIIRDGEIIKLLALDQSTKSTGWSLWTDRKLSDYGLLTVENTDSKTPIERMVEMHGLIKKLVKRTKPDYAVIEDVQLQGSAYVFCQLSQMQGMIFSLLAELHTGFEIIPATKWKSFCGIKGRKRAEQKANTILLVKDKYGLDVPEDIADAIGLGTYFCSIYTDKKEVQECQIPR